MEQLPTQSVTSSAPTVTASSITLFNSTPSIPLTPFTDDRLGEHTISNATSNTQPFSLQDVAFRVGNLTDSASSMPVNTIPFATFSTLCFVRQKNGEDGEMVGHARSGHSLLCPVLALTRRVLHLRRHNAPPHTPLCTVYLNSSRTMAITSTILTSHLRTAAAPLFHVTGFAPSDISARALRAGGAMALLCANVDPDVIKLLGRWRSDQMLRYLHLQSYPQMHSFSKLMLQSHPSNITNAS
jgi:hypothetical protein